MKILLILFVLLFSSSVVAEVFNCELTLTSEKFGNQKYKVLVDTGDKGLSYFGLHDEGGEFKKIISTVFGVGKIYLDNGHPYGLSKIDTEVYFLTMLEDYKYIGIFFTEGISTININKFNSDVWEIFITDTTTSFDYVQSGTCQ